MFVAAEHQPNPPKQPTFLSQIHSVIRAPDPTPPRDQKCQKLIPRYAVSWLYKSNLLGKVSLPNTPLVLNITFFSSIYIQI